MQLDTTGSLVSCFLFLVSLQLQINALMIDVAEKFDNVKERKK